MLALVAPAALAACGGGQSTDDFVPDGPPTLGEPDPSSGKQGLDACPEQRAPIPDPDAALVDTIDRLMGRYPIAGAWGSPPAQLDYTPSDTAFEGELILARRAGELARLEHCELGVEVPVTVALRTDDGALAETLDATALLTNDDATTVDGSPPPLLALVRAAFDLRTLSGGFTFADDPTWTFANARLSAEVTPYGTRGVLDAAVVPRQPTDPETGASWTSPASDPLLTWQGDDDACVGESGTETDVAALYPAPTEAHDALQAAVEAVATETYLAKYADGTETRVAIELDMPTAFCATSFWASYWHFPTEARLRTDDGRLDLAIAVAIDPSFALLHFNQMTEVAWAFPPARLAERIGHVDAELAGYAHVGIEAWFDLSPAPAGWIKVLGYHDGDCGLCDADEGCIECSWDARVEVMALFIGSEADDL